MHTYKKKNIIRFNIKLSWFHINGS